MSTSAFYLACAAKSLKEADEAALANVRERCLRSAKAWQVMAERALHMENERRIKALAQTAGTPSSPAA